MSSFDYSSIVGRMIRMDRGGHESRKGRVLYAGSDYIALHNENEGVVYYSTQHPKSITVDTKDTTDIMPPPVPEDAVVVAPKYIEAKSLRDVLDTMRHRWVQINRGGAESVQGVISEVNDSHIVLVSNYELVNVFTYHVRSISYVPVNEKQEKDNKDNENKNSDNKKNENKNDENKGNENKDNQSKNN